MNYQKLILGSIVGGLIGAAAALLFAPKAGVQLRKTIAQPLTLHLKDFLEKRRSSKKRRGVRAVSKQKSAPSTKKKKSKKATRKPKS